MTQPRIPAPPQQLLSLGGGVQSSTMLLLSLAGEISPPAQSVVFADTLAEKPETYEHLRWLAGRCAAANVPYAHITGLDLRAELSRRAKLWGGTPLPLYTSSEANPAGQLRQQCTTGAKIEPIHRHCRHLMRGHYRTEQIIVWIGISTDEADRIKPSKLKYIVHRWPLIELGLSRDDCRRWLQQHKFAEPPKSACYFCPHQSLASWGALRREHPGLFADAVALDTAARNLPSLTGRAFFAYSRRPLSQISAPDGDDHADLFSAECTGHCGL